MSIPGTNDQNYQPDNLDSDLTPHLSWSHKQQKYWFGELILQIVYGEMWLIGPIRGQHQCHVIINWPMRSLVTDHRSVWTLDTSCKCSIIPPEAGLGWTLSIFPRCISEKGLWSRGIFIVRVRRWGEQVHWPGSVLKSLQNLCWKSFKLCVTRD